MDIIKKNLKKLQKKACERYQNVSEEEKGKSKNMIVSDIKIFEKMKKKKCSNMVVSEIKISKKMKNKSWLSKEKIILG